MSILLRENRSLVREKGGMSSLGPSVFFLLTESNKSLSMIALDNYQHTGI